MNHGKVVYKKQKRSRGPGVEKPDMFARKKNEELSGMIRLVKSPIFLKKQNQFAVSPGGRSHYSHETNVESGQFVFFSFLKVIGPKVLVPPFFLERVFPLRFWVG